MRDLDIRGVVRKSDGSTVALTARNVVRYTSTAQTGANGLPLGTSEAASYNLQIDNADHNFKSAEFDNAEVSVEIGIKDDTGHYAYQPFGKWFVETVDAPEQSVTMTLTGYDALASRFETEFDNSVSYPTTLGSLTQSIARTAGVTLKSTNFLNSDQTVEEPPEILRGTTARDMLGYIAACAAGFAKVDRSGRLEIVSYGNSQQHSITPSLYTNLGNSGGRDFGFNCLAVKFEDSVLPKDEKARSVVKADYTRYVVDPSIEDAPNNTIRVEGNPILTPSIASNVAVALRGLTAMPASVAWGGDPSVALGDTMTVTNLKGETVKMLVNEQSFTFDGGLSVTEGCNLPASKQFSADSYAPEETLGDKVGYGAFNKAINELDGKISGAEILIDELNATIDLKAWQSEVDGLSSRLSQAEINIDGAKADILLKASVEEVDALRQRVSQAEIDIDGANAAITLKASQSDVDALSERVSQAEVDIDGANAQIALKASKAEFDELGARVAQAEIDIDGAESAIALKASKSEVDDIASRVTQAELDIDGAEAAIALKASQSDLDGVSGRLTQAEADIDGANAAIALKASQSSVDTLAGRVAQAELDIDGAEAEIALKVSKDGIISAINLTTEEVKISAAKINLDGYVTATELGTVQASITNLTTGLTKADTIKAIAVYGDSVNAGTAFIDDLRLGEVKFNGRILSMGNVASITVLGYGTGETKLQHSHSVTVNDDGTITLGEVATSGGTFKIADTKAYKDGVSAAINSVTLSSAAWDNGITVVTASNGKTLNISLPSFTTSGGTTFGNHHTVVYFSTPSVSVPLKSVTVDATSEYESGQDSVTLSESDWVEAQKTVTASNGQSVTIDLPEIRFTGGVVWNDHKTWVIASTPSRLFPLATYEVDATSEYTSGRAAGANSVTLSAGGWDNGNNVVTASNGKTETITLPTFSTSGGTSFTNHKTTVYFSTPSVNVPLKTVTVDATSEYEAGRASVEVDLESDWDRDTYTDYDNTLTVTGGGQSLSTRIVLTQDSSWTSGEKYVYFRSGNSSGTRRARLKVSIPTISINCDNSIAGLARVTVTVGGKTETRNFSVS